jgi:hypothetical protein
MRAFKKPYPQQGHPNPKSDYLNFTDQCIPREDFVETHLKTPERHFLPWYYNYPCR